MRYVLLLLIVVATQYGYHLEGVPAQQAWTLYVMRGVQDCYLFVLLWLARPKWAVGIWSTTLAIACALGGFEEAQNAICGIADWKDPAYVGGLCLHVAGPAPYLMIASVAITAIVIITTRTNR